MGNGMRWSRETVRNDTGTSNGLVLNGGVEQKATLSENKNKNG